VRIFLIPITKQTYALHINTILRSSLSAAQSGAVHGHDVDGPMQYPPTQISVDHIPILKNIRSVRIKNLIDNYFKQVHDLWADCEQKSVSHPSSFRGRIYIQSQHMLRRIDGCESFFASVPHQQLMDHAESDETDGANGSLLSLCYITPRGLPKMDTLTHLRQLTATRIAHHQKWLYVNICALPFTLLLGLAPGPNIFFLYNAFRTYCHYKAMHGAKAIQHRQHDFECTHHALLDDIHEELQHGKERQITDTSLTELQHQFQCAHIVQHTQRVRYQVVSMGRNARYALLS